MTVMTSSLLFLAIFCTILQRIAADDPTPCMLFCRREPLNSVACNAGCICGVNPAPVMSCTEWCSSLNTETGDYYRYGGAYNPFLSYFYSSGHGQSKPYILQYSPTALAACMFGCLYIDTNSQAQGACAAATISDASGTDTQKKLLSVPSGCSGNPIELNVNNKNVFDPTTTIATPDGVDYFGTLEIYSSCTTLTGPVNIDASVNRAASDLHVAALSVTSITGTVTAMNQRDNNEGVSEFEFFFPALTTIGGSFKYRNGVNPVTTVKLPNLATIGGDLDWNVVPLQRDHQFPSAFNAPRHSLVLTSFEFPKLTSITGSLIFGDQLSITTKLDFPLLTSIGGNLIIPSSLLGSSAVLNFPVLASIGGNFEWNNCKSDLSAFGSVTSIGGHLTVSFTGANGHPTGLNSTLVVTGEAKFVLSNAATSNLGAISVNANTVTLDGGSTQSLDFTGLSTPPVFNGQSLTFQNFLSVDFTGFTKINHRLTIPATFTIDSTGISSFAGLEYLSSVESFVLSNNANLHNAVGLYSLRHVTSVHLTNQNLNSALGFCGANPSLTLSGSSILCDEQAFNIFDFTSTGHPCTGATDCTCLNVDPSSVACGAHGTCSDATHNFVCQCNDGFQDDFCQTNIDECASFPCVHGSCQDGIASFFCSCGTTGFDGPLCDHNIDDCVPGACGLGRCEDGINSFVCECTGSGFTGDHCQTNIDDCVPGACDHGSCVDGINTYTCDCSNTGFTGPRCETNIDECASGPCIHGDCFDGIISYVCTCLTGYTGVNCQTDINECSDAPCVHGVCHDGINEFTCDCANTGYDGPTCNHNINDCVTNICGAHGTCNDGIQSYTCTCDSGYSGPNCQTNINDCASNPCGAHGTCNDGVTSYTCDCANGYTGSNCQTNINDCASNPCGAHGTCNDGVASYTCSCASGYTGVNCETNINDCASNPCGAHGTCNDGVVSYTCSCASGYTGSNCQTNINDCASNPCGAHGTCNDGVVSYTCSCASGYSGVNCEININDCASNPCGAHGTCNDGVTSYTCSCASGYSGVNCQTDINECTSNPCLNGGTCKDGINSRVCVCATGYSGTNCETGSVSACAANPCQNAGTCVESSNGRTRTCTCTPFYQGTDCAQLSDYGQRACTSTQFRCYNGARCVMEFGGPHCICKPNTKGERCEVLGRASSVTVGFTTILLLVLASMILL